MAATHRKAHNPRRHAGPRRHLRLVFGHKGNPSRQTLQRQRALIFTAFQLGLLVLFVEVVLRALPFTNIIKEPRKSMMTEISRLPLSNTRTYGRNGAIMLPSMAKADIVVVGDNYAFGPLVTADNTFSQILGRYTGLRVANLAGPSQKPVNFNRVLEMGARYQPKTVLYTISPEDFVTGGPVGVRQLSSKSTNYTPTDKATFIDSVTQLDPPDLIKQIVRVTTNPMLTVQWLRTMRRQETPETNSVPFWTKSGEYLSLLNKNYWDPRANFSDPDVQYGFEANIEYIRAAARFGKQQGFRVVVVMIPSKEMVYGPMSDNPEQVYDEGFRQTFRELSKQLGRMKVRAIDLTDDFRYSARRGKKLFFSNNPGLNEMGHEEAAKVIRQYFRTN